jgi:hypothetical protein
VPHLIRRFFGFLRARPLAPSEQRFVAATLSPALADLFFSQPYQDQRHAFDVAAHFHDPEILEAALLHDVGKAGSGLGAVGRSLATVWGSTGLPVRGRWSLYLAHGRLGADMLAARKAAPLTVSFARHHPGPVPEGIDARQWHALAAADDA